MKFHFNICHFYLFVILLCALNGTLYTAGGFISQGLQALFILMSLYYTVYANLKYNLPYYFKGLDILLMMFTIYGVILIVSGERLMIKTSYHETSNITYLKSIYLSLLPVFAFYVFAKKGLLTEKTIKIWFFLFLVLAIKSFFNAQERMLQAAIERGSSEEEFTNNVAYTFIGLFPALVLFYKKPIIQYLCLAICAYFIILGMKRGAMLIGGVCLIWFLATNLKAVPKKRKWLVVLFSIIVLGAGLYFIRNMMENSLYFQYRIAQTQAGEMSGREDIYSRFFQHFINESTPTRLLFGNGANATLKIGSNYAHNDWLEIAINQGFMGVVIYLAYWICFFVSWRKTKKHSQAYLAVGMLLIIYFISTLFSMSYNGMSRCASMVLGYYLATGCVAEEVQQDLETEK